MMIVPVVFISYAWSALTKEWVLDLAHRLASSGVKVVLDEWDLLPGHDSFAFMERMVSDPLVTHVLMVCDELYAKKADARGRSGVSTETQIITPAVYAQANQDKFIPIVASRSPEGTLCLPAYLKTRFYIDLSSEQVFEEGYEKLLRRLFNKPLNPRPPLGEPPRFVEDETVGASKTRHITRRASRAIERDDERACRRALAEFWDLLVGEVERSRAVQQDGEPFDERVWQQIADFKPYRDEWIELLDHACREGEPMRFMPETMAALLERCLVCCQHHGAGSWREGEYEPPKFITHELFLCTVAVLVRRSRPEALQDLVGDRFLIGGPNGPVEKDISCFDFYYPELDQRRKGRLRSERTSIAVDLLKSRCDGGLLPFSALQLADFLVFLRISFHGVSHWVPRTLICFSRFEGPLELFAGARTARRWLVLRAALGVDTLDEMRDAFLRAFPTEEARFLRWGGGVFGALSLVRLTGLAQLFPKEFAADS